MEALVRHTYRHVDDSLDELKPRCWDAPVVSDLIAIAKMPGGRMRKRMIIVNFRHCEEHGVSAIWPL